MAFALLFGNSAVLLRNRCRRRRPLLAHTHVPDVLNYMASIAYNNSDLLLPRHGGVRHALRRAPVLRDLPVSPSQTSGATRSASRRVAKIFMRRTKNNNLFSPQKFTQLEA
jgi:hypothetical protein